MEVKQMIEEGRTSLGIEFGSTRIKAVLIDEKGTPFAAGSHEWENRYDNGIWTYTMEDVWEGLQDCYRDLLNDVKGQYGVKVTTFGLEHGEIPLRKKQQGNLLRNLIITFPRDGVLHICIRLF